MSLIYSSLTGAGTCLEALAGALLKSCFNLFRAGEAEQPSAGWDRRGAGAGTPQGCTGEGRGSQASPAMAAGGAATLWPPPLQKSPPRWVIFFWGRGEGGRKEWDGAHPRLAAGNPAHQSLSRASRPSEISRGCSQAQRTSALSLRCSTAVGAASPPFKGTGLGVSQTFTRCWREL